MTPPSSQSLLRGAAPRRRNARALEPPRRTVRARLAGAVWLGPIAALGLLGCQRSIDMASVQDPSWAATTIPYTGVREPTRQFPDYGIIDASILDPAGGKPGARDPSKKNNTPKGTPR